MDLLRVNKGQKHLYIQNKDWPPVVNYKRGSHTKRQAGKEALQGQPTVVRIKHQLMIFRRSRLKLLYSLLKTNNTNMRKLQKAGCAVLSWSKIWAVLGPVGLQFPPGRVAAHTCNPEPPGGLSLQTVSERHTVDNTVDNTVVHAWTTCA